MLIAKIDKIVKIRAEGKNMGWREILEKPLYPCEYADENRQNCQNSARVLVEGNFVNFVNFGEERGQSRKPRTEKQKSNFGNSVNFGDRQTRSPVAVPYQLELDLEPPESAPRRTEAARIYLIQLAARAGDPARWVPLIAPCADPAAAWKVAARLFGPLRISTVVPRDDR